MDEFPEIGRGRPTLFREEMIEQAKKLAKLGATDMEVADFFGVDVRTIYRWKNDREEFCQALNVGKQCADDRVVRSLYQRACGFEHDSEKIFCSKDGEVTRVPIREFVVPDTTAGIFWLKNRQSQDWRDKQDLSMAGPDGGPIQSEHRILFVDPSK